VSLEPASTANPPSLFSLVRQLSAATWQALAGKSHGGSRLRYGQAGPLLVARSFERYPRAGTRSERTITTYLIGLRQADTSHVPPDRARYGLPRPTLSS
jgi:hypothetical protein